MKNTISAGISCNLDTELLNASIPLFQEDKVEIMEWSFDALHKVKTIPDWFDNLIQEYSKHHRLIGHGIYFSLFLGKWSNEQAKWLAELKNKCQKFHFDHISEHFGFMSGMDFHKGAPLPVPLTKDVCLIGQDRLKRIQDVGQCPVGIENLALALSIEDVKKQGGFLHKLVAPINGFIILDLHNIYCQLHNFNVEPDVLLSLYPLENVREIHISGGSWEPSATTTIKQIRRDTHDNAVPEKVFELLSFAMERCPNLKYVILEQLGRGLITNESKIQFRKDFYRMSELVNKKTTNQTQLLNSFLPTHPININITPPENKNLYFQQQELSEILENCTGLKDAKSKLFQSKLLASSEWGVESWQDHMLGTAIKIAQKWKDGFNI